MLTNFKTESQKFSNCAFGGHPVADMDAGSLLLFYYCGIRDFRV